MATGTGKTRIAIELLRQVGGNILVICPEGAILDVWEEELERWWWPKQQHKLLLRGSIKSRVSQMQNVEKREFIAVTNYEGYWRQELAVEIDKHQWSMIIYDECHRLRSWSAKQSKFARLLRSKNPNTKIVGLSGSISAMYARPDHVYAVTKAIAPDIFNDSRILSTFKNKYCDMASIPGRPFKFVTGMKATAREEFMTRFHKSALEVGREVSDLPPLSIIQRSFRLDDIEAERYTAVVEDFLMWVKKQGGVTPFVIRNGFVKYMRMRQATSGFFTTSSFEKATGRDLVSIDTFGRSRLNALRELVEDLPQEEPVVVFSRFIHDLAVIKHVSTDLKRPYYEVSGRRKERKQWIDDRGGVLGVQFQAGGEAIQLTHASNIIFYSMPDSYITNQQCQGRVYRTGQTRKTIIHYLTARMPDGRHTIDKHILTSYKKKREQIEILTRFVSEWPAERTQHG